MGGVEALADAWRATWTDSSGATQHRKFPTERESVALVAAGANECQRLRSLSAPSAC
jgi:hypothetical protein